MEVSMFFQQSADTKIDETPKTMKTPTLDQDLQDRKKPLVRDKMLPEENEEGDILKNTWFDLEHKGSYIHWACPACNAQMKQFRAASPGVPLKSVRCSNCKRVFLLSAGEEIEPHESEDSDEEPVSKNSSVTLDGPVLIRILEYAREDLSKIPGEKGDVLLHFLADELLGMGELSIDDYEALVSEAERRFKQHVQASFAPARQGMDRFREGDRVRLTGYFPGYKARVGEEGTVGSILGAPGVSPYPDPLKKMVFVIWDESGPDSVFVRNVEKVGRRSLKEALSQAPPVYREWECQKCGHTWTSPVSTAMETPSLRGGTSVSCPECGSKQVMGSAGHREDTQDLFPPPHGEQPSAVPVSYDMFRMNSMLKLQRSELERAYEEAETKLEQRLGGTPDVGEVLEALAEDLLQAQKASGDTSTVAAEIASELGLEYQSQLGVVAQKNAYPGRKGGY
jgi:DNA-directed RNA polymerase subunit RPC12/RpoP